MPYPGLCTSQGTSQMTEEVITSKQDEKMLVFSRPCPAHHRAASTQHEQQLAVQISKHSLYMSQYTP